MCREIVGHAQWKRAAISPALITPPRNHTIRRIWRRVSCAIAASTASRSSSRRFASVIGFEEFHIVKDGAHRLPDLHHSRCFVTDLGSLVVDPREDLDIANALFT